MDFEAAVSERPKSCSDLPEHPDVTPAPQVLDGAVGATSAGTGLILSTVRESINGIITTTAPPTGGAVLVGLAPGGEGPC